MPFKCVVPFCKGNYRNGPKVSVFSFPNDKKLCEKWIYAIRREHFLPTKNSRVSYFFVLKLNIFNLNFNN